MTENQDSKLSELLRFYPEDQETVFDLVKNLEEGESRVVIERRPMTPVVFDPPKKPARKRAHVFNEVEAFAEYLTPETVALADVDNRVITAVIDESDETDREMVTLEAKFHPQFEPWRLLLDKPTRVKGFALHCMKHRRSVIDPDGRELALTMSQVKASKKIEQWSGVGNGSINGIRVELAVASEKKGELVEIPESIVIELPIFLGTKPQRVTIDLTIDQVDGETIVFCTSADFEEAVQATFAEMIKQLKKASPESLIGFGLVKHEDWRQLETVGVCRDR